MSQKIKYLVLAYNHNVFDRWCREHSINPRTLSYFQGVYQARGIEFELIFLEGWSNVDREFTDFLHKRATDEHFCYFTEWTLYRDIPVVQNGEIIGWKDEKKL